MVRRGRSPASPWIGSVPHGGTVIARWLGRIDDPIAAVWNDSRSDELARYVTDLANGTARQRVVSGVRKSKRPEAGAIAADLLEDDDVVLQAFGVLLEHPTVTDPPLGGDAVRSCSSIAASSHT